MAPTGPSTKPPINSGKAEKSNSAKGEITGIEKLKKISTNAIAPKSAAIIRRRKRKLFIKTSRKIKNP